MAHAQGLMPVTAIRCRLLERLDAAGCTAPDPDPARQVLDSVLRHLTRLLNTRRGMVPLDPEFGVADLSNRGNGVLAPQDIEAQIRSLVLRYEPRLRDPRVHLEPAATDALSFTVEATLADATAPRAVRLHTTVNAHGRIGVQRTASAD
jgi:type VI secretion system protein